MNLQKTLENYGLEEKEAKTYLALLELGETTATALAQKTNLDRTLMYQLTNKLIEKGLTSYIIKNNVRYFTAAPPQTLLKNLQEKQQEIKSALPELKAKQSYIKPESKVEIFKGRQGINTILKMIINDKKSYNYLGGAEESCTIFAIENENIVRQAEKLKIKGKLLARKQDKFWIAKNEDYRFVPENVITTTSMAIWGNKTAIFVWAEPHHAILIDNKEITQGNLSTFNYLWQLGEKPTKADRKKRLLKD
ncbi:MAG: hypothetical protein KJ600_04230 [Nanoarchaeota archaeon]|nr:hypothetical protein [Nanoarchaeota archaeon]MBU1103735.1 hypothetical protein [Nanoarchaeota archaeon]